MAVDTAARPAAPISKATRPTEGAGKDTMAAAVLTAPPAAPVLVAEANPAGTPTTTTHPSDMDKVDTSRGTTTEAARPQGRRRTSGTTR